MKFALTCTFKSIRRNLKMNIIISLTLFVAYLFFFLVCCYIEDGLFGLSTYALKKVDQSILFTGQVPFSQSANEKKIAPVVFNDLLKQYDFVEQFTVVEYDTFSDPITKQEGSFYLVDKNFNMHFQIPILLGRYFTEDEIDNGAKVCIINEENHLNSGLSPGDVLQVGEHDLKIVGVMKYIQNQGVSLVPYKTIGPLPVSNFSVQWYYISAQLNDINLASQINWDQLGLSGEAITGQEHYANGKASLGGRSISIIALGLFILTYALINLINIQINKLDHQKKNLGIRIALGATYRQIALQFFLECLFLVLTSVIMVFASEFIVGPIVRNLFNHHFGMLTFIAMIIISIVSSFFISLALFKKFKRLKIVEVIKDL